MNKTNAALYLPIVQAMADGKTIQMRNGVGEWADANELQLDLPATSYRIKPEVVYAVFGTEGIISAGSTENLAKATKSWYDNNGHFKPYTVKKFVEDPTYKAE